MLKIILKTLITIFLFAVSANASVSRLTFNGECHEPHTRAPNIDLSADDFVWDYSLDLLRARFIEVYESPKRLPQRAYWDSEKKSYMLPYLSQRGGPVKLPLSFVERVADHIEMAFSNKYIDAVFFPDMGHSHFMIPIKSWNQKYDLYAISDFSKMYSDMMKDPGLKILYHTAEQLKTLNGDNTVIADPEIQWRHKTRNIVGSNVAGQNLVVLQNPSSPANTVGGQPNYFWFSAGFNLSANKDGCFSYRKNGQRFRFDISLFDLE